jgi:hypothetical protein
MARVIFYRVFKSTVEQDPTVDAIRGVIQQERLKINMIHQITGVASATVTNWLNRKTIKPQNATLMAVSGGLGYVRHDRISRDGTIEVNFEKVREYDYKKEIEKQADFLLNNPKPNKKRKKAKSNGSP